MTCLKRQGYRSLFTTLFIVYRTRIINTRTPLNIIVMCFDIHKTDHFIWSHVSLSDLMELKTLMKDNEIATQQDIYE